MSDYSSKLKNGMLLFHGSYAKVEKIDLGMCENAKDFGKGFYLTSDVNQARSFIKSSIIKAQNSGDALPDQNYGYISSFRYYEPKNGILTYEFLEANKEWLWFIAQNRRLTLAKKLTPKLDSRIFNAEIIIGKVANDKTNAVRILEKNNVEYDYISYPCKEAIDGVTVAEKLGADVKTVFKTLVTCGKSGSFFVFEF